MTDAAFIYTGKDELDALLCMPRYNDHIAQLCANGLRPGMRALDFGAGIGTITDRVRGLSGATIDCIERDPAQAAILRGKGYNVYTDAADLPENTYDLVFSSNVLEHIEDDTGMLRALHRAVRTGGRMAFWVPAFNWLWTDMDDRVEHFRRYTRATLENSFIHGGFRVEKSFYQDFIGVFATLALKILEASGLAHGNPVNPRTLGFYDRFIFPLSKIMDLLMSRVLGKNVFIYARKEQDAPPRN